MDRTQPQTLYMATILLYLNAALAILTALIYHNLGGLIGLVFLAGEIAGGWGIANEKKWGFWVAAVVSVLILLLALAFFSFGNIINLVFDIALVALLFHPQSTAYRKTWFR
ncbi:hypothetical protein GHK86_13390 [Acidimicrobiaceae bacterium USS-CC1]|uniref:Uncharacterized protein n=1 Tax=Acidiferrimicrobium australe TaxID=2664430 RepID=A0ABW9QV13_9ACTN|nr:hypothetical protein [Acidiferrimicrobium australe]